MRRNYSSTLIWVKRVKVSRRCDVDLLLYNTYSLPALQEFLVSFKREIVLDMACEWREINVTIEKKKFANMDEGEEEIDVYSILTQHWGHITLYVFGPRCLGDYFHIVVEHSTFMFRRWRYVYLL